MVTITKIGEEYNSQILEISGLSTDPKPVDQIDGVFIANGSTFKEIDTGKEYTYNESAETWHINKSASSGGTGSGVNGKDGITPNIGENGNWFIGTVDTEVPAQGPAGENGVTPHIGTNGNWYIGSTDTGVSAKGVKGDNGLDGNGIKSAILNSDYTLTLTFDNGTTYTTPSIRGATGDAGSAGKNGTDGKDGSDGVGIASIKQTTTSTADGGNNVFTVTLTNGTIATFTVKNGSKGSTGKDGSNGVDGGHYTPVVTQPTTDTMQISFSPSKSDMPAVNPVTVNLPVSENSGQNPIDPEDIAEAVADYMAENPVSAEVGDGTVTRAKLADDLAFAATNDSREAPNQYGYGWYYDHTRRTAANILGEMYRTKLANELADADTIDLFQEGDALQHNICIAEDTSRSKIYAVYAVSTDSTDNAGSTNCYVRLSVITNPYTKARRTVEHYKVSGNGQYGGLNIVSGTSDANIYVDSNGVVHIWFNATDESGVWKIAHCTFDPDTGSFADYEWCTLTVGENEATQLTGDALTSIDDPSITYQKGASLQMNGKYCVFDGYLYAGNCSGEVTRNGMILRTPATNCRDWEFVCCPQWQHESHGKCELSIGDSSPYNQSLFIALRQVYQTGGATTDRASAPLLVAMVDRSFAIQKEWLVPDCASRPWWIGQSTLIHNPENRHTANVVNIGSHGARPISFERMKYANYCCAMIQNNGWGNNLVMAGTQTVNNVMQVGISIINKTSSKVLISSLSDQQTSEAAALAFFAGAGMSLDTTLEKSGYAADAAAVGTALAGKQPTGNYVKTINGNSPDPKTGDITVAVSGSSGGADVIDTIINTEISEETTNVTVSVESAKYKEFLVYVKCVGTATNTQTQPIVLAVNNNKHVGMSPMAEHLKTDGVATWATIECRLFDDCAWYTGTMSGTVNATTMAGYLGGITQGVGRDTEITSVCVSPLNKWATFGVGTTVLVKGVRA